MKNYFLNFIKKIHILQNIYLKNKFFFKKRTYSMHGEDLVVEKYFKDVVNGFYVDLGCYHPVQNNNTMLLYQKGWRGINIDISEFSINLFDFCRPDDLNLNFAVSDKNGEIDFYYQKKISALSTIKKSQSDLAFQGKVKKKKITSQTLTQILDDTKYKDKSIDFLDIDIEGADLDALKSLDFSRYSPKLICVEILHENMFINNNDIEKSDIYNLLKGKNYKRIWSGIFNHIFVKNP
tara:strand:+ start:67 stop:774 length:708 start_codon:yes stop_codon:yes gene_type:complete